MSGAELFDPAAAPAAGWPPGAELARSYLQAFADVDSCTLIANLRTRVTGVRWGEHVLPTTVNTAEYGDAYVCLPHTAYALYAKAELALVDVGRRAVALGGLADVAGAVLRAAAVNRIVHLDNWMLSTNLHGRWTGEGLAELRAALVGAYPRHILAVRSVNRWSDAVLTDRLLADGWRLLPSRQIYVCDDLERDWAPRRDTRRDLALLAASPLTFDELATLQPGDAERIAELYAMLYLQRYSTLNPAFTPAYIAMTHRAGLFVYRGLRADDGRLVAVAGCLIRSGVLTTPIVGYDTTRPIGEGLYRMTSVLFAQLALERRLRLNGSAGAAAFKRHRGARPLIEYTAMFIGHLPLHRRLVVASLQRLLDGFLVPLMVEKGL